MTSFGRYRLLERLGVGGMAEVFKAKSFGVEGFEKVVVIKRILPELAKSPEFVEMFIHEAKLAVRLSHANIVQVFDLGIAPATPPSTRDLAQAAAREGDKEPDAYYMAMEYVHGFDLATLLARVRKTQRPLPIELGVYVASEVAKGLDHAHRRRDEDLRPLNIVHRDVSPQNVLLSLEGEVKVTDFGIAKARDVVDNAVPYDTRARKIQGKFGYMSPEQARGESVDARSDLFSLGVVLYECVAGVNPFSAPTTFETLRRVQACEFPPVELLRPEVSSDLIAIVRTAMAKNPEERYPDAGRMYEAMLAYLYAQGRRYGAHDLAEILGSIRASLGGAARSEAAPPPEVSDLDREPLATAEARTPVEIPTARTVAPPREARDTRDTAGVRELRPPRFVPVERAAEMGERREVTALVIELPVRETPAQREKQGQPPTQGERAASLVRRYGGRILKQEPEQITALFGTSDPDGRDTEVAVRCALVVLRALDGARRPSAGLHSARIHVSSDGEPTEDERLNGLVAEARDLARLVEGRCAVSFTAMRPLRSFLVFEPLSEALPTRDSSGGPPPDAGLKAASQAALVKEVRGPSEGLGRFVGRKRELRRIGELLAVATKRSARVLTLRGDHGVGKTRLLYEVERRLRKGGYNVGFYLATCPPRGRELPLSGIVCMLQTLCGITEGDGEARILSGKPRLRALGLHDDEVAAVLGVLGASVVPSSALKGALRNAFARMVTSLCEDRPHMFSWDAAHGMDTESFTLLEGVFTRLRPSRVLFAFAARAGFSHPMEKLVAHTALELGDLEPESLERLVSVRLGVEKAPDDLVRFVRERAGGHPQFAEELVKALVDARAVTVADKAVVSMKLVGQDLALPKTLRGLVASRIARLAAHDRATLQAAAVLADPLDAVVLAQMLGQPMSALEGSIARLQESDFLLHTGLSELRFRSPVVREVVVDALTHEAAREMHAAAGNALETVLDQDAWEHAARIAPHLYEAGDRERAATYFAKSAERRLETGQLEAAARDYARAIDLCTPSTRTAEELASWLSGFAAAVRWVRSAPEASEMCERLIARIDQVGDRQTRVRARIDAGRVLGALHRFDAARDKFDDAERIAEGDERWVRRALLGMAEQAVRQGDFRGALDSVERLEKLSQPGLPSSFAPHGDDDREDEHKLSVLLALARAAEGDLASAQRQLQAAAALLPDDAMAECEREKLRAVLAYLSRDFRGAVTLSERAVDAARKLGLTYEVAVNLHNLGDALVRLADLPRAYGAFKQSLALADEAGFERLANHDRMFLAYLDGLNGDAEAYERLEQGIRYAESNEFTWDLLGGRTLRAHLQARRGDTGLARTEFEGLRVTARGVGNQFVVEDCRQGLVALDR